MTILKFVFSVLVCLPLAYVVFLLVRELGKEASERGKNDE